MRKNERLALESAVRETIRQHGMFQRGDRVLVAVSGGADSTALLLCLDRLSAELGITLTVAHMNHRIRGPEGDEDEDFVRRLAAAIGILFVSERIDVRLQAIRTGANLEEAARRKRYEFLRRAAESVNAQKIAVGHNLNDQAETTLFRLTRGSGIEGLSGIYPVVDGMLVRPMIDCSRRSIEEYLDSRGAAFREDSTNRDPGHSRNRIRHELIPYLEKHFNPKLIQALAREALLARELGSYIESEARAAFGALHSRSEDGISFAVKDLLSLHPALEKQLLRHALKQMTGSLSGFTLGHVESLLALCRRQGSGRRIQLPHGVMAVRQFGTLLLCAAQSQAPGYGYRLQVPGQCLVPEIGSMFIATLHGSPPAGFAGAASGDEAFFELQALPAQLTVRSRRPGDCYGGAGRRKVKRMLIDAKVPLLRRPLLPMLAAGRDVIWIPGFRPARGYEPRPGSERSVRIQMVGRQEKSET